MTKYSQIHILQFNINLNLILRRHEIINIFINSNKIDKKLNEFAEQFKYSSLPAMSRQFSTRSHKYMKEVFNKL